MDNSEFFKQTQTQWYWEFTQQNPTPNVPATLHPEKFTFEDVPF